MTTPICALPLGVRPHPKGCSHRPVPGPKPIDWDAITEREAEDRIGALYARQPEVVGAIIDATLHASPLAGPIRILRELTDNGSTDTQHVCVDGRWITDADAPTDDGDRCSRCGERIL